MCAQQRMLRLITSAAAAWIASAILLGCNADKGNPRSNGDMNAVDGGTDGGEPQQDASTGSPDSGEPQPLPDAGGDGGPQAAEPCEGAGCGPGQRCEIEGGNVSCVDMTCDELDCDGAMICASDPSGGHVCSSVECD